ncbi:Ig-like domain-containing protein [Leucobacter iarius]|uniref:Gram-positive cocci surface proteins LPxTG domain-containing protein n=1 Tax=Leucobacter iarius TaxID=333963 RepID=A0ABP4Y0X9_9MICO
MQNTQWQGSADGARRTKRSGAGGFRRLSGLAGALALAAGLLGVSAPAIAAPVAAAAPTVTYPDAISNISIAKDSGGSGSLSQWEQVRISADWAVPNGAKAGETFGMALPQEFSRYGSGSFELADPSTGVVMATCQASDGSGPQVVCTLTSAVNGLESVGGDFWMQGVATQSTTSETVEFEVGGKVEIVDLPGGGGITPEDLTEPDQPYKFGGATAKEGRIEWVIGIPRSSVAAGAFTVKDALDPKQENHSYTGEVQLNQRPVQNGQFVGEWTPVDPARYSVKFAPDNKSFEFSAQGLPADGFSYRLNYFTQADGQVLEGDVFGNTATVQDTTTSSAFTVKNEGGGTASGKQFTRFTIVKQLDGAQAAAAQNQSFSVKYSVKGTNDAPKTMTLRPGQPVKSDRAPLGSTFVIEEVDLPKIDGVAWGTPVLTGTGVRPVGGGAYEVTPGTTAGVELVLTNLANPVVPPTPTPPVPTVPPTTVPPTATTPPATPKLATTGGDALIPFWIAGAAAIVLGLGATGIALRRRTNSEK